MPGFAGFIFAAASAVCNGSFAAISKSYPNDPQVFNLHLCVGVLLSSMIAPAFYSLSGNEFGVTPLGLVAGLLLVLSTLFSFLAIPRVGLAIGQGVWGGVAIIVSFLWGAVGPDEISGRLDSLPLSILAVAFLVLGIYGILLSERFSTTRRPGDDGGVGDSEASALLDSEGTVQNGRSKKAPQFLTGIGCAVLVGCFGGSILVPLSFVPAEYQGIGFLPSFGIGAFVSGAAISGVYLVANRGRVPSLRDVALSSPPGVAAGFVWNLGNVCSILAMGPGPLGGLSYGVAYPIMQCALFVSGLWGVFWFKEINGFTAIGGFFSSGAVLVTGAVVLGLFGPQRN